MYRILQWDKDSRKWLQVGECSFYSLAWACVQALGKGYRVG